MATPGVNIRVLRAEIAAQAKGKIAPRAERAIQKEFDKLKRDFIREFNNDPVTQEIEAGPEANTTFVEGGYGNLYSLLGFDQGDDPIDPLRDYLNQNIILDTESRVRLKGNKIIIDKRVEIPSVATMEDVAESETSFWGGSWLRLLHRGIPYVNRLLLQLKNRIVSTRR